MVLMKGAYIAGILSIVVGIFFTPIPKELGFYRFLARQSPLFIGLNPVFHHGIPWGYTWEEWYADPQRLVGKSALVTGANSGIGYDLVEALARVGASVTMVCRNPQRCHDAKQKLLKSHSSIAGEKIKTMIMDTSSLASVRAFAEEYVRDTNLPEIDFLYLNAGMAFVQGTGPNRCAPKTEKDGIDYLFQVNFLGHHLLYRLLEPKLGKEARVVSTSSASAFQTYSYKVATSLETLHGCSEQEFDGGGSSMAYGQSKLAQIVWTKALDRRLRAAGSSRIVNVFHPGLAQTEIQDKIFDEAKASNMQRKFFDVLFLNNAWQSPDGALTGIYLAQAEDSVRGKYFHPQAQEVAHPDALDQKLQDGLWEFSNKLVEDYLDPISMPNNLLNEEGEKAAA